MDDHLGTQFARALARRDAAGLKALLRSDVDFRAMTPGKFWEATDPDTVVDDTMLGIWFEPERRITEVLRVETDRVGSLDRVAYRFKVERPEGDFVIEQQAYFKVADGRISWLRIMCSGFLPAG